MNNIMRKRQAVSMGKSIFEFFGMSFSMSIVSLTPQITLFKQMQNEVTQHFELNWFSFIRLCFPWVVQPVHTSARHHSFTLTAHRQLIWVFGLPRTNWSVGHCGVRAQIQINDQRANKFILVFFFSFASFVVVDCCCVSFVLTTASMVHNLVCNPSGISTRNIFFLNFFLLVSDMICRNRTMVELVFSATNTRSAPWTHKIYMLIHFEAFKQRQQRCRRRRRSRRCWSRRQLHRWKRKWMRLHQMNVRTHTWTLKRHSHWSARLSLRFKI